MTNTDKRGRGGRRPGAGRPPRTEPKARPVWVGQITEEQRQTIIDELTPDERCAVLLMAALDKMTEEERMHIKYEFSSASLWGDVDPDEEGYDAAASEALFAEEMENHLADAYPDAEIEVIQGISDRIRVDGMEDHDEIPWIEQIVDRVYSGQPWEVELEKE